MPKKKGEVEYTFPDATYVTTFLNSFGFESGKLGNVYFMDNNTVITAVGNTVQFINTSTGVGDVIMGKDGGGIGAICVHPSRKNFVVAEKGDKPNVYIYSYPGKEITYTLRGGTEQEYSSCTFNAAGDKLATVGGDPDYMLTVWNWAEERIILRYKAFGTRVHRVSFSVGNDGQLTTCGAGHIKFWKMARTFTGLKLQGEIGKFGKVEISDISGYAELPDTKVLSGSESGALMLWENNLVKCEIGRSQGVKAHDGPVEIVLLEEENQCFITAGHDGYLRWWPFPKVDQADTYEDAPVCAIEPAFELKVADGCKIKGMNKGPQGWFVQDANGAFYTVPYPTWEEIAAGEAKPEDYQAKKFKSFHADRITCLESSPVDNVAVTAGDDGTVRLFDFINKKELYRCKFSAGATCIQWLPLHMEPSGTTFVLAFANGVVRVLRRCKDSFALTAVMKPHTAAITSMCYSHDGKGFVTASEDGTLFFFVVEDPQTGYRPLGFTKTPAKVTSLCWEQDRRVLCGCEDGSVLAMPAPEDGSVDQSVSFEFEAQFQTLAYNQVHKIKEEENPARRRGSGIPGEDDDGKEEELLEEEEEEEEEEDQGPWRVNFLIAPPKGSLGKLLVGMQLNQGLFEYSAVNWLEPGEPVPEDLQPEDPLRNLAYYNTIAVSARYSRKNEKLLIGCEKGKVLMRNVEDLTTVVHSTVVHDGMYGTILQATTSFDDAYLLTAGADGCFFVQSIENTKPEEPQAPQLDVVAKIDQVEDIINPDAYSIQEAKLKADEDRRRQLAEEKKKTIREQVEDLMQEYEEILKANDAAEEGQKVPKEELILDPEILEILQQQNAERVEIAYKEMAWDTAKKELKKEKLKTFFIDSLQVERIMLHGFKNGYSVSSFRTANLTERQRANIAAVHELTEEHKKKPQNASMSKISDPGSPLSPLNGDASAEVSEEDAFDDPDMTALDGSSTMNQSQSYKKERKPKKGQAVKSALDKAEDRKREREERERGFKDLEARKPNENTEDHKDMQAIMRAEKYMGDYKLKTDNDYVVPENQRVTAERKLRQLILLEESVNTLRMDYNDRFLALRDLKRRLIENIRKDNGRIKEINTNLKLEEELYQPEMKDDEEPENRTQADKEALRKFEKEQIKQAKKQAAADKAKAGFGADFGAADDEEEEESEEEEEEEKKKAEKKEEKKDVKPKKEEKPSQKLGGKRAGGRRESLLMTAKQRMEAERKERLSKIQKSSLEEEEENMNTELLMYEKRRLQRKIDKTISTFDHALDELRGEKFKLEGDLKMADMKLLLLFRELMLLKDFKKQDQQLSKKLEDRRNDKADIMSRIKQCQEKLGDKKVEIERLLTREKQIMTDFNTAIANSPAQDALVKIFKKKIKRKKAVAEDEEENSDEESDSDVSDDSDDEDDKEEEVCPPGVAIEVYQRVVDLRDKRLEQEDIVNDFQKSIEALRKENEALSRKERSIDTQLGNVEKEIQSFQNEKQKKLNELETVVVLKFKQIQSLTGPEGNKMPKGAKDLVVFTNNGMKALHSRILDLFQEKKALNKDFQDLRRKHVVLMKARKEKQANVGMWESKVYEIQLLKFGQRINLESLENVSVDRKTEELKQQLRLEEMKWEIELKKWDQKLQDAKEKQASITSENSTLLKTLGTLRQDQQKLEDVLNVSQNKILLRMTGGSKVASAQDRRQLKELVILQQQEIDQLKAEIAMLSRKGGHVYTPVINKATS